MIEKIYAYSNKKKILKKYAFFPPLTATNPLRKILILIKKRLESCLLGIKNKGKPIHLFYTYSNCLN